MALITVTCSSMKLNNTSRPGHLAVPGNRIWGRISKSKLLNFIEERSYVDYLTCFKMHHIVNGITSGDVEEAVATSSRSVCRVVCRQ